VESGEDDKVRMVHGVPKLLLQVEAMFLYPYFNFLRKETTPMLWGYETMVGGIYKLYTEVFDNKTKFNLFLGVDWKSFDKNVSFELIDIVHECWSAFIDFDRGYMPTAAYSDTRAQPDRMQNLWNWMTKAVKHSPILLPDGTLWKRRFATLASGMLQTQILDSWINSIVILTCLSSIGFDIDEVLIKLLGDDSFVATTLIGSLSIEDILPLIREEALRRFGFVLNDKSQCQSTIEGITLLGYKCDHSLPKRSTEKLLAQLLYPERYPNLEQLRARAIGIAMASCGRDDIVYKVCDDVVQYCDSQGVLNSDPTGSHFRAYIRDMYKIDLSVLPSQLSLLDRLQRSHITHEDLNPTFWRSDYFLSEY
jgi:hypothetical protein